MSYRVLGWRVRGGAQKRQDVVGGFYSEVALQKMSLRFLEYIEA